jgi:hypothetical protein
LAGGDHPIERRVAQLKKQDKQATRRLIGRENTVRLFGLDADA